MIEAIEKFLHGLKIITKLIILIILIALLALLWKSGTGFFSKEVAQELEGQVITTEDESSFISFLP